MKKVLLSITICFMVMMIGISLTKVYAQSFNYQASSYLATKQQTSLIKGASYNLSGAYCFIDDNGSRHTFNINKLVKIYNSTTIDYYCMDDYYSYSLYLDQDLYIKLLCYEYDEGADDNYTYDYTSYSSSKGLQSYNLTFTSAGTNAPVITGVTNETYYNSFQHVYYSDVDNDIVSATYQINGGEAVSFSSGIQITSLGKITITVIDETGNTTVLNYYQDFQNPNISGVVANGKYNTYKTISYSDNLGISSATYTVNNGVSKTLNNNTSVKEEGEILITVVDKAGNSSQIKYYQDVTAPTISAPDSVTSYVYNPVSISDIASLISVTDNMSTFTITYQDNYSGNEHNPGIYQIVVVAVDSYSNRSEKIIYVNVIDDQAPRIYFKNRRVN